MSTWAVIGLIAIVLGVIVSNIMLLKYSAKFKMPKAYTPPKASDNDQPELKSTDNESNPKDQ